jgi:trans-2,3-dihydro-3-hydroxyanthranilate isomerase
VSENVEHLAAFDPLVLGVRPAAGLRRYLLVDVFTQAPLEGNGLGVFTDGRGMPSETMQRLARELNLSETVFILPPEEGGEVRLRIFTPTHELPFAGHPVLGTAFIAASALERQEVSLETGAGLVHVELSREDDRVAFGRMRQPIPSWRPYDGETELLRALGVSRSGLPVELYCNGPLHVYVELEDEAAVAALRPDMAALADAGEVGVSCFAGSGQRWKTRMFAPAMGVPEDPATGSAAGPLAVHLSRHGRIAFGEEIRIRQGAEIGRPSLLYARADGSPEHIDRVEVGGSAVIVGGGAFAVDA